MDFYDEIARVAYALYERDGRIDGRDLDHWLEAEMIVLSRYEKQKPMALPEKKRLAKAKQKKTGDQKKSDKKAHAKATSRKRKTT
jgi:hypothetical protein